MEYFGGPVIPNAKVYVVWWGDPANLNPAITAVHGGIADFFAGVTNSSFIDWLNEYDTNIAAQAGSHAGSPGTNQFIGRGNYAGTLTLSGVPTGSITDAQIQSALDAAFTAATLPAPDENTIYAIYFPSSVSITLSDGSGSCTSFGAYHDAVVETQRHNAYYLVMPDCGDSFAGTTNVSSHELAEAITDGQPTPGSNPDYPQAWNDSSGSEVGDLCQSSSGTVSTPLGTFTVQGIWDERSQGCKVFTSAAQDFNVGLSPNAATLAAGATGTFAIQTATVAGSSQSLALSVTAPAGVTATLSQSTVTSGQSATLTVSASGSVSAGQVVLRADGAGGNSHTAALLLQATGGAGNDFSLSASPSSLTVSSGSSGSSTVATSIASGSAESISLSASGQPSGVTVSFSPASVNSGASSTMMVSVASTASAGTFAITVTGSAASGSHTVSVSLTVTSTTTTNDFSIAANPASVSLAPGASGTSTITTAVTAGKAQSISLGSSGAPAGVTVSFNPSSVTAGGSSAMTISASASATPGTATITVTGAGASATHTAAVALTITGGAGGGGLVNGGFESGFSGWTTGGTTSIVTAGCHGGSSCAQLGSTSPTNGDSSAAQTFTAPSNSTGISLWYKMTCPDTVQYDWATVTLLDNTAGGAATLLADTCVSNAWTNVTGALTAGHSYTLTLVSHDDDYAADPSYTLYDDVSVTTGGGGGGGGGGGVINGGFESGLSGWTASGTTAAATSGCHSGNGCAQLGSTSPTNGDSSVAQTFTVPAGMSQLSVWYASSCPDTVQYDWATVTLLDNTSGVTVTMLPKTCASSSVWTDVTAAVTAGHSYTLTLVSHDDNYAADPTFTLYDDVTLN